VPFDHNYGKFKMIALVIAEHNNLSLHPATLNVVTAATQCVDQVHVLVTGHHAATVAEAAARISGVTRVIHVDCESLQHQLAENVTAQILAAAEAIDYTHYMFASTAAGKNTAPRLAAMLDVAQVSDVIQVITSSIFCRPVYAGSAIATVQSTDTIQVLTVRATAFDPAPLRPTAEASAITSQVRSTAAFASVSHQSSQLAVSERPELTAAKIVVSGGRALGSPEQFMQTITPLADKLGAAIGASRAAVDAGYAPNDWQVGQTGKIVAPDLYVAVGISGAIQHWAGMKDSKVIVAINTDAEAPIFGAADYSLQADLFVAVPELTRLL